MEEPDIPEYDEESYFEHLATGEKYYNRLRIDKYKEYLESIRGAVDECSDKKSSEICKIMYTFSYFAELKFPRTSSNLNILTCVYIPSMIDMYQDLLVIANYESAYLPLRQIFESILIALQYDLNMSAGTISDWLEDPHKGYNLSGQNNNAVINRLTPQNTILNDNLQKLWKKLCFRVHKHNLNIKIEYAFEEKKFDELYTLFVETIKRLVEVIALKYPEYKKLFDELYNSL